MCIEHHNPIGKTDYLSIQHIERYRFALSKLTSAECVLDIACGTGYGTAMMLRHGCKVVGADYNDEVIANARVIWKHNDFVRANALDLPFDDNSFDCVISFETIEHVYEGSRFLSEMHRVLRPDGIFICSTLNIRYTFHPPFHVKEYSPDEFYKLFQQWFKRVECYGQYFKPLDRMMDLYRRHMYSQLVAILSRIGIKETLKRLLKRNAKENSDIIGNLYGSENLLTARILKEDYDGCYKVQPFIGSKWLRIMIVVAKKEGV